MLKWPQRLFDYRSRQPLLWKTLADEHRRAGEILFDQYLKAWSKTGAVDPHDIRLFRHALFWWGMASELMLKAIIISNKNKPDLNHDLRSLAVAARLTLTEEQKNTLALLQAAIHWKGRYPAPKKYKDATYEWTDTANADLPDFRDSWNAWYDSLRAKVVPPEEP